MIETRGLTKLFKDKKRGEIRAVNGVSFRCQPGQIYGLLGANGAGKTTTLRMLATILEPSGGTAQVCGFDVLEQPEKVRANVGFLSTATALYPRLTAQEMVEYFGRLNGIGEAELKKRVDEIFARLDMNSFRDRRCDKLSTGMKQKTSIARTLIHDPQVMIFDEPTLGSGHHDRAHHPGIHPRVPAARKNRDFLDACDERSGKALRHHRHYPVRQTAGGGLARRVARAPSGTRSGRDFRQGGRAALPTRGGGLKCRCRISASSTARN